MNRCWPFPVIQNKCLSMKDGSKLIFVILACALSGTEIVVADEIAPIDCMIVPNVFVELSSSVPGVLGTLSVDKSDEVKKGQVVATLNSDIEQVQVKTSKERLKLSKSEHGRTTELYASSVITQSEKDQADNDIKLAQLELTHARTNLALRQVRSPIDGVVVKRYFTAGEFVANKPIVKLAQLHPLRVEVVSPVENYGKIFKGMRAKIKPDFGDYTDLVAEVVVVDKVIDAASGTFGVRLELDNKDHAIPGGLKCMVSFIHDSTRPVVNEAGVESKPAVSAVAKIGAALPVANDVFSDAVITEDASMCVTIGPYKTQGEIDAIITVLEGDIQQKNLRSSKSNDPSKTSFLVSSEAIDTMKEARLQLKQMEAAGLKDIAMLKKDGKFHVAAGVYSKRIKASHRVSDLLTKGYHAKIRTRLKTTVSHWADLVYLSKNNVNIVSEVPENERKICEESVGLSLLNPEKK